MRPLYLLLYLLITPIAAMAEDQRTLVFVLFDGLAPQMVEAANTPNLDQIRQQGSWTHEMAPVFPTISAVNHVSYTTGCVPGAHGIVSNYFHDPEKGPYNGERDADWRLDCDTLWELAEQQGRNAAALGFVGHFSPIILKNVRREQRKRTLALYLQTHFIR